MFGFRYSSGAEFDFLKSMDFFPVNVHDTPELLLAEICADIFERVI